MVKIYKTKSPKTTNYLSSSGTVVASMTLIGSPFFKKIIPLMEL